MLFGLLDDATPTTGATVVNTTTTTMAPVRDTFIDLVCQDEELLRAEFEALVAASWQAPPPPPPAAPSRPASPPPGWPAEPIGDVCPVLAGTALPAPRRNRQRSPPSPGGQEGVIRD